MSTRLRQRLKVGPTRRHHGEDFHLGTLETQHQVQRCVSALNPNSMMGIKAQRCHRRDNSFEQLITPEFNFAPPPHTHLSKNPISVKMGRIVKDSLTSFV